MSTHLQNAGRSGHGSHADFRQSRRQFLQTLACGGSAASLMWLLSAAGARAAEPTEALLLSCMDFRLVSATSRYMASRGLTGKYDHIILAGAALGAVTDQFPAWNQTFWDHVGVAIELHKIHRVLLLDHRDCGAYKVILGEDFARDAAHETAIHATQLKRLESLLKAKYPALQVELLLMALDGTVETIA